MERDECQKVVDALTHAQYLHQKQGGDQALYGKAALTIVALSKSAFQEPCELRLSPDMRRDSFRVIAKADPQTPGG